MPYLGSTANFTNYNKNGYFATIYIHTIVFMLLKDVHTKMIYSEKKKKILFIHKTTINLLLLKIEIFQKTI